MRNISIRSMVGRVAVAVAASLSLASLSPAVALAEHIVGSSGWRVTYTADGELSDNYSESGVEADIRKLQPGDDLTIGVTVSHESDKAGDWYMSNEVLKSLEAGDAEGSGYGYVLTYERDGKVTEIYRSSTVGGTGSAGLVDATHSLDGYFYLDTLSKGQTGKVTLVVSLDGETELNAYFNKFARIRLMFAVEERADAGTSSNSQTPAKKAERSVAKGPIVRTGEETNLLPIYVAMMVSGVGIAVIVLHDGKRKEGTS